MDVSILLLAAGQPVHAATYYSDPAAVTGQADGSAKAPWPKLETMTKNGTLPQLKAGDTLLLRSGSHGDVRISGDNAAISVVEARSRRTEGAG